MLKVFNQIAKKYESLGFYIQIFVFSENLIWIFVYLLCLSSTISWTLCLLLCSCVFPKKIVSFVFGLLWTWLVLHTLLQKYYTTSKYIFHLIFFLKYTSKFTNKDHKIHCCANTNLKS